MSKNAGDGGLAGATRADKKISVSKLVALDGIFERAGYLLLSYDIVKRLRAIPPI